MAEVADQALNWLCVYWAVAPFVIVGFLPRITTRKEAFTQLIILGPIAWVFFAVLSVKYLRQGRTWQK